MRRYIKGENAKRYKTYNVAKGNILERTIGHKNISAFSKAMGVGKGFWGGSAIFTAMAALEGEDLGTSVARGIGEGLLWNFLPGPMTGYMAATGLASLGPMVADKATERRSWWNQMHRPNFGIYQDTQQAMTMRQAAVQAISGSKLNARSALGQEAQLMHRPYRG